MDITRYMYSVHQARIYVVARLAEREVHVNNTCITVTYTCTYNLRVAMYSYGCDAFKLSSYITIGYSFKPNVNQALNIKMLTQLNLKLKSTEKGTPRKKNRIRSENALAIYIYIHPCIALLVGGPTNISLL